MTVIKSTLFLLASLTCVHISNPAYSNDREIIGPLSGWFYVETEDCLFPIPNNFVLRSDVKPLFFYKKWRSSILGLGGNIFLRKKNEVRESDKKKYIHELLSTNNDVKKYSVENTKDIFAYIIETDRHSILISGVDVSRINYMFEYCALNKK